MIDNLHWLNPAWLWLLPLALILLNAERFWRWRPRNSLATTLAASPRATKDQARLPLAFLLRSLAFGPKPPRWQRLLYQISLVLLFLALSEPVIRGEEIPHPPPARDITFLVDASVAMGLRDYTVQTPSGEKRIDRLTLLKQQLSRMIKQLSGERMSLIVFGEHAYTLVPLTRDTNLLQQQVRRVQVTVAGRYQAIGEAIALGVQQAKQSHQATQPRPNKRLLILLSPAQESTGDIDARAAAHLAHEEGIPLYTVIIGAETKAAEEQRSSGLLYDTANRSLLESLAHITGALSFTAGSEAGLQRVLDDIARRETTSLEIPPRHITTPLFFIPLGLALLLISLGQLITLRPAAAPIETGAQRGQ